MNADILMLKFRTDEDERKFFDTVQFEPELMSIYKNHGATPGVIKRFCDKYNFDIKQMFEVYVPGRKELE